MCTSSLRQDGNGIGHPFAKVLLLSPSHVFLSGPCGPVEWLLHDSSRIALLGDSREVDGRFVQLAARTVLRLFLRCGLGSLGSFQHSTHWQRRAMRRWLVPGSLARFDSARLPNSSVRSNGPGAAPWALRASPWHRVPPIHCSVTFGLSQASGDQKFMTIGTSFSQLSTG